MRRVFVVVLDSAGVGALPDAERFGDQGAHTIDHIVAATGGLDVPRLIELGLGCIPGVESLPVVARPEAAVGRCAELSPGKDTSTGHWEMMNCPLDAPFPVYEEGFPSEIIDEFIRRSELPGILANRAASGTVILEELGEEHLRTGKPIVYTSADSVFQVAAHEEHFGLERLYSICRIARELLVPYQIGRVIARPFIGEVGSFQRTYNRRDYSLVPPRDTTLDRLTAAGVPVVALGKIDDIFAARGMSEAIHTQGNRDGMRVLTEVAGRLDGGFVFINLIDFDMLYGHRRDPEGYRRALEDFDRDYVLFEAQLRTGDVVILTADHGNDPTHALTTDHTREYVPLLVAGPAVKQPVALGTRSSFADIGATVEDLFGLDPLGPGRSFAGKVTGS